MLEESIKAKLDQATTEGMTNANYSRVATATEKLVTSRVRERAAGIESQIFEPEESEETRNRREWSEPKEWESSKRPKVEETEPEIDLFREHMKLGLIGEVTEAIVSYTGLEEWKKLR